MAAMWMEDLHEKIIETALRVLPHEVVAALIVAGCVCVAHSLLYLAVRLLRHSLASKLRPAFGVYWDADFAPHCVRCRSLLKSASGGRLFCPSPACGNRHTLTDTHGKKITVQEAIRRLQEEETGQ